MKTKELIQKDDKSLKKLLAETKSKLVKDRFKIASREMTNVSEIKKSRTLIAKIETIVREREIMAAEKEIAREGKKTGVKE
ncbi:MAG: 50S ribosomal protein L29 [Patescibacteria group bacterium]|nr:50S ribosomal protein L29 [Patescibacteria group bacterium]